MALILSLDENNSNSWSGEPTSNLLNTVRGVDCTFETYSDGADTGYFNNGLGTSGTVTAESGVAHTGTKALKVVVGSAIGNKRVTTDATAISLGNTITISGWFKADATMTYRLYFNGGDYSWAGTNVAHSGNGEWEYIEVTYGPASSNTNAYIMMYGTAFNQIFYADEVQMEVNSYATRFINGARTNFTDLSGNDNDADVSNMTFSETQQGLVYNGSSTYAYNSGMSNFTGDPIFTVMGWFKRTGTISADGPWGLGGGSTGNGITAYTHPVNPNKISIDLWGTTTFNGGEYPLNDWVHVAWVKHSTGDFSMSSMYIYVNGVKASLVSYRYSSSTPDLVNGYSLGRISVNLDNYYSSILISNFKVYDTVLSTTEIQAEYNRYRSTYNKPVLEGVYAGLPAGPLLYEFNCLTDTSLKGEETENLMINPLYVGESGLASEWTSYGSTYSIVSDVYYGEQSNSQKCVVPLGTNRGIRLNIDSTYITLGDTFTFSFYGKGWEDERGIGFYETSFTGDVTTKTYLTDGWTRFAFKGIWSSGNGYFYIRPSGNVPSVEMTCYINKPQLELKSYATPFTPTHRNKWQSTRNLANRSHYGSFYTAGTGTAPTIDAGDFNGLVLSSTDASNGNFATLSKPEIVTRGLVLHLDAGNVDSYPGSGTTVTDLSGHGYDATLQGTTSVSGDYMDLGATGDITNYITIPPAALTGLSTWTIDLWLYMHASNSSIDTFVSAGAGNNILWYFTIDRLSVNFQNPGATGITYATSVLTPFLITMTGTGGASGTINVYKNGVFVNTMANNSLITVAGSAGIVLGQEYDNDTTLGFASTQKFLGKYGPIKFYNRVLSTDEIEQNYNAVKGRYDG